MPKEPDLEKLERLLGLEIEDVFGTNVMKFQGSLTGISRLSPLKMRDIQQTGIRNTDDPDVKKDKDK